MISLPPLPYPPSALEPVISRRTVELHHGKHQKAYVDQANAALRQLEEARGPAGSRFSPDSRASMRGAIYQTLAFNAAGAHLHQLYWENLAPPGTGGSPEGALLKEIEAVFKSPGGLVQELIDVGKKIQGDGWVLLTASPALRQLNILPVQDHQLQVVPGDRVLLAIDVWEHAYYLDRPADRAGYLQAVLEQLVNWGVVARRLAKLRSAG